MTYRVVQWGTGNVGRRALGAVLEHPELELVGCHVTSDAKVGRDVGELLGREPIGVVTTGTLTEVLELAPDCVLHMPLPSAQVNDDPDHDTDVICALLASGVNVVTTVGYLHPKASGIDVVGRLEAACTTGRSTLHGTGANPGFMSELMPLVLSGLCRRIDRILVRESSDFSRYPSADVVFGLMGMGASPEEFERRSARYRRWLTGLFRESVLLVADGLGVELGSLEVAYETALTAVDRQIAAGVLTAGSVAAQRWTWTGVVDGRDAIVLEAVYRAHPDVAVDWAGHAWVCRIEGRPTIDLQLDHWLSDGLLATAMHAVHAVVPVCRAAPGIATFLDLPLIVGRHTVPRI